MNPNKSEMSATNERQWVRIRCGYLIAQYREEIELFKEQICGVRSTLIKKEEEAKLAERERKEVITLNKSLLVDYDFMKQANDRAFRVCSLFLTGKLVSFPCSEQLVN